jgi:16S rRNA (cytidine1402-2'-O)-methyltransferase
MLAELKAVPATLVFFESAQRLGDSLAAMAEILGDRPAVVARELTKLHEDIQRGSLRELAARFENPPRGEVTLLVAPPQEAQADTAAIDAALRAALAFMPVKAAAEMIAGLTGQSRKTVYARALELKNE